MTGPLYTEVFKEAWRMVWHHKKLLWFGLLATFIGSASIFEFLIKAYYRLRLEYAPSSNVLVSIWSDIIITGAQSPGKAVGTTAVLLVASVVIFFILLYFFVSAQGTLIAASAAYLKNKKMVDIRALWDKARSRFWPLLAVTVARLFLLFGFLVLITIPLITFVQPADALMSWPSAFLLIVLILLVGTIVSFIALYASNYVVLHGYGFGRSVRHALRLFANHWLVSCEVGVLMLVINILTLLVAVTAGVLVAVPIALLTMVYLISASSLLLVPIMVLLIALFVLIGFILAVYTTWVVGAWTSLFLHMDRGALLSRVLHWTKK